MSDSTVFNAGQSLRRREMLRAAAAGTVGFGMATASSGTAAASTYDDAGIEPWYSDDFEYTLGRPIESGLAALYTVTSPFRDDGYTKESVEDMTAENHHLRIYDGANMSKAHIEGATDNLSNYISTDDPTASPQAEMVYSELRTTALQAVRDGDSTADAANEGREAAELELTGAYINLARQWNQHVYDVTKFLFTFSDAEDVEWSDDVDHGDGTTLEGFDPVTLTSDEDLPSVSDVWRNNMSTGHYAPDEFSVTVQDLDLPNGETEPVYRLSLYRNDNDWHYDIDGLGGVGDPLVILHPDDNTPDGDHADDYVTVAHATELGIADLYNDLETIRDDISTEAEDTIEEIMDYYVADDLEDTDILSSFDFLRSYGDSGEMDRYTAELLAAGLDAPDDLTHEVTIYHPDTGVRTGRLFLSWDWSELREWEYQYDADAGTLEVDPRSIDDDPELVVSFDGAEDVTVTADDLDDDGVADLGVTGDDVEMVERFSQGDLSGHIPVDTETDHWDSAIFVYGDEDVNRVTLDTAEPFELVGVEDEDGNELDALELEGWQNVERDPALSLREAQHTSERYVSVSELEETAHGGGGGGGGTDTDALLIGGGIIALIGMIIAALSSGGS